MLWKESLCKTWIVFILIKCICLLIKINHVWSCVKKNIAFKKTLFSQKTHFFPKNPLFPKKPIVFQYVHFLSHCFETKNYHCLKLKLTSKGMLFLTNCIHVKVVICWDQNCVLLESWKSVIFIKRAILLTALLYFRSKCKELESIIQRYKDEVRECV